MSIFSRTSSLPALIWTRSLGRSSDRSLASAVALQVVAIAELLLCSSCITSLVSSSGMFRRHIGHPLLRGILGLSDLLQLIASGFGLGGLLLLGVGRLHHQQPPFRKSPGRGREDSACIVKLPWSRALDWLDTSDSG